MWDAMRQGGHATAREELFLFHAPFARGLARRAFRQRSRGDVEQTDFEQLAYEALIEAISRFDPDRGTPFSAFAKPRILGNIADGIARMTEVREQLSWRHRMRRDRLQSLSPGTEHLSADQALEALSELALGLALGFMLEGTGLYAAEDAAQDEAKAGATSISAYESAAWKELMAQLERELSGLEARERTILQLHYIQGMAFEQVASLLTLSKGRISQLHKGALMKLRKRMAVRGHFRLEK